MELEFGIVFSVLLLTKKLKAIRSQPIHNETRKKYEMIAFPKMGSLMANKLPARLVKDVSCLFANILPAGLSF